MDNIDIEKILENKNISEETKDMITRKYPPLSDEQKNRILSKVNIVDTKEKNENQIRVVSEKRKNPALKIFACAAAFLIIAGGVLKFHTERNLPGVQPDLPDETEVSELTSVLETTKVIHEEKVPCLDDGFTMEQAENAILDAGFVPQVKIVYSDTVPENHVVKTEPEGNTLCEIGSEVIIHVSRGDMNNIITIPEVSGMNMDEAKMLLEDTGFVVKIFMINSEKPEGTVVSMSHSAGQRVEPETEITLHISTGVSPTYTQELEIHFPENADGIFSFKVFVDGAVYEETEECNSEFTRYKNITINSSGSKKEIAILLVNRENGMEHELGRYSLAFDGTGEKEIVSEDIPGAFSAVDGLSTD